MQPCIWRTARPRRVFNRPAALGVGILSVLLILLCCGGESGEWTSGIPWPEPPVVDPGPVGGPPADAIVLFDGKDLSQWRNGQNWIIQDGYAICRGGGITSKQAFGDCQLHLEWAAPEEVTGSGQGRGNSGVYLMSTYEVQILDSYDNTTYFDGQCGAIYKQSPPLVNACRKPGQWQSFDIIFKAPQFDSQGNLIQPACVTVLQNGVLIQDHFELQGATAWDEPPKYTAHPAKLPLHIQDHGNPVRFRNIWIRELQPRITPQPQGGHNPQAAAQP
jgi:hypothetical protein